MQILSKKAVLVESPAKFTSIFQKFPEFRVVLHSDNCLSFEDIKTGDWFINTTPCVSISQHSDTYTCTTRNSTYRFLDIENVPVPVATPVVTSPVASVRPKHEERSLPNHFFKVSFVDFEVWDEKPDWATSAKQLSDGAWVVKTFNNSFHKSRSAAQERADYLLHCYDEATTEEVAVARELGCIKLNGIFDVVFAPEFIVAVDVWAKRINSYGEFAFSLRKRDRKQMREELAPLSLDKFERRNRLDYMREFA